MNLEALTCVLENGIKEKALVLLLEKYPDSWISMTERYIYDKDLVIKMPKKHYDNERFFLDPKLYEKLEHYANQVEYLVGEKLLNILTTNIRLDDMEVFEK